MTDLKGFRGAAKRLEDVDLPRIGSMIGVGEDILHVFMDVEAPGSAFDPNGRPRILFEPHVFYRNLLKDKRERAVRAGLARAKWVRGLYGKESEQYPKLIRAMEIDEIAALKSASWGRSQILGENYKLAGFASVEEMVVAFMDDEDNHLEAMIEFIKATKIDDDLRRIEALKRPSTPDDWRPVVRVYNGPAYEANGYHIRASAVWNRWRKIPDTPWTIETTKTAPRQLPPIGDPQELREDGPIEPVVPAGDLAVWLGDREIDPESLPASITEGIQKDLRKWGYYMVGKVDGSAGGGVKGALAALQNDRKIPIGNRGNVNAATIKSLENGPPRPISKERANTTIEDLRNQGSKIVLDADDAKVVLKTGGGIISTIGAGKAATDLVPDAAATPPAAATVPTVPDTVPPSRRSLAHRCGTSGRTGASSRADRRYGPTGRSREARGSPRSHRSRRESAAIRASLSSPSRAW
jgi:hypothetical protein